MAIYKRNIVTIDLSAGSVHRSFVNKILGEGDARGDQFGFRVVRDGQEVDLSGATVSGFFIRANGSTVVIDTGDKEGSTCWVTLPTSCYIVEGNFTLTIKLATSASNILSTRIVDGTVVNVGGEPFIDPGSVIPNLDPDDYDAWVALVEAAAAEVERITIDAQQITGTRYRVIATKASS